MAENVGSIYFEVQAKTDKLVNGEKQVDVSLNRMNKNFDATSANAKRSEMQLTQTAKAVKQVGDEAKAAQSSMGGFGALLAGFASLQGANALIQMAEGYGEMAERIRMATSSAEEYDMVQARLLASANATYRPLKEAQELYILTADSLRSMGYNTEQAIDVVDSMSYAFVKNATSQERAQSAISAFTGAIMTGKLEADAWKTIIAAMPTVINDLAQSTGKSTEEIRKMGAEGKLTASILSEGLRQSLDQNAQAAQGMATTVKDAFAALNNSLSVYIGEANMANGTTGLLSKSILLFADNLETVVNLLTIAGAGVLAKYIASTTAAAVSAGAAAIAARLQAAEELKLATAQAAATAAAAAQAQSNTLLGGTHAAAARAADAHAAAEARLAAAKRAAQAAGVGLLSVLGGPAGIIALAASAAASIYLFGSNSANAAPNVDKLTESVDKLTAAQLENRKLQAQDAIDALKKKAQDAAGAVNGLEKDYAALNAQMQAGRGGMDSKGLENVNRALVEARAESDGATRSLQEAYDAYNKLAEAQATRTSGGSVNLKNTSDPEVTKRLEAMREELELAKLTGEARARLQAIQKLGANATAEERAEAEKLAAQIFKLEEARKGGPKVGSENVKQLKQEEEAATRYLDRLIEQSQAQKFLTVQEQLRYDVLTGVVKLRGEELAMAQKLAQTIDANANIEAFQKMGEALGQMNIDARELAMLKAEASLNSFASPEEVALMRQMAAALWDAQAAEQRRQEMASLNPAQGANEKFAQDMLLLQQSLENKEILEQEYDQIRLARITEFEEQKRAIAEETFRKQSEANNLLMNSLDALGSAGTSALTGILNGTMSLSDAMRSLGQAVLGEVVKSFVQMGIEYVKSLVMGQTAQAAAAATAAATGGLVAASWAPAAAMVSLATLGANAAPASAALATTTGLASALSVAGGRQYGGPVAAGNMYRINENGAPEIYKAANGQQYMLPNTRGEVISNADATSAMNQGAAAATINVTLIEDAARGGQVEQTEDNSVRIFVADIRGRGEAAQTLEQTYGLTRRGR